MKTENKNLKIVSIVVLVCIAASVINIVLGILGSGAAVDQLSEQFPPAIVKIAVIITHGMSFVLLLPELYVGLKGLKVAKNPDSSGAHIVWAKVLIVLTAISLLSAVSALLEKGNLVSDLVLVLENVAEIMIFIYFIKYANQVRIEE